MATAPGPAATLDPATLTSTAWQKLLDARATLGLPDLTIVTLPEFLAEARDGTKNQSLLTQAEQEVILDQAETLIGSLYPHLPFKVQDFAKADPPVNPLDLIASLRNKVKASSGPFDELEFHIEMLQVFASVRDPHSSYTLPSFFQGAVAFLPFRAGFLVDQSGRNRFYVTGVMDGFVHPSFQPGAELVGGPDRSDFTPRVDVAAALTPGANSDAQRLRGVARLTLFPLATAGTCMWREQSYDNQDAQFWYLATGSSTPQSIMLPWGVARASRMNQSVPGQGFSMSQDMFASLVAANFLFQGAIQNAVAATNTALVRFLPALSMPETQVSSAQIRSLLSKAPQVPLLLAVDQQVLAAPSTASGSPVASRFPDVFEIQATAGINSDSRVQATNLQSLSHPEKKFGYVAIKAFNTALASEDLTGDLVAEFKGLLAILQPNAPDGLIVDIRGNPGGDIQAAEGMLQMLTPKTITPLNFHLANTPAVLGILKAGASELGAWAADSGGKPLPDGPLLTSGQPLTGLTNQFGQIYQGPVVLVVDALTYSAADMFAAGFADNGAGPIIGPDASTGGGGASRWSYSQIQALSEAGVALQPLPQKGVDMSLAFLRCTRIGPNSGVAIEDLGVKRDIPFARTLQDLLAATGLPVKSALITSACETLASMPVHRITVTRVAGAMQIGVEATGIDSVDFLLEQDTDHPVQPTPLTGPVQSIDIPLRSDGLMPSQIAVRGFSGGNLVATTRLVLRTPPVPQNKPAPLTKPVAFKKRP